MVNLYNEEELARIEKIKETNDKLEEFFNNKRAEWTSNVEPLFDVIKNNINLESFSKVVEAQSIALSFRQNINEQISFFLNKRSKEEVKIKKVKQDKFMFYALGVGLKTSLGEKNTLIDAHIAENERNIQLIENYVEFLRSTSKNLEALGFTIKNIIELMNYLGR